MPSTYLILGQSAPAAGVLTTLYTTPAATSTVVSSIIACNTSVGTPDYIRISIAQAGAADTAAQYIYGGNVGKGFLIQPLDTFVANLGTTLATTDLIRVYSQNGTTSFNLSGVQLT